MTSASGRRPPLYRVRQSAIHGRGVFAARRIRKGTRIIEYVGERVSHAEADRRYEDRPIEDNHTFLFIVDRRTVIDAGVDGNAARFINHSCAPNCETVIEDRRVFIEAVQTIQPGEELSYDYQIMREKGDPPDIDEIFACRCGAPGCRGTMLSGPKPARRRQAPGGRKRGGPERHAHGRSAGKR
jgi:SET domain-containing protein